MRLPHPPFGLIALLCSAPLAAQTSAERTVVLQGRVSDAISGLPVVQAEIVLPGPDLIVRTGADGRYRATRLARGTYLVLVRSLGYQPWIGTLALHGADTANATFLLHPMQPISLLASRLPDLDVQVSARPTARMKGFVQRRALGLGFFLDRQDLARREQASRLSDVLRMVPGAVMVEAGTVAQGLAVNRMMLGGAGPLCYARVYLDGQKIYDPNSAAGDAPPNLDAWPVQELEAIEVYRGVPETPVEYLGRGADCGTVLLWTRSP